MGQHLSMHMNTLDPHHISNTRLRNTLAVVLLVHVVLLWGTQSQLAELPASDDSGQVVMADVVSDIPSPAPLTRSTPTPRPVPTPNVTPTKPMSQADTPVLAADSNMTQDTAAASTAAPSVIASGKTSSPSLVEPSVDADYLKNPPPSYPRISRRNGEQGTVIVRVFISTHGTPDKVEVRTSSGFARLDQAALDAVQRWRFVPGRRQGTPEAMWFNIPVRFILE